MVMTLRESLVLLRYQRLVPSRFGRNERNIVRFQFAVVAGMGSNRERRPQNVEGNFFVGANWQPLPIFQQKNFFVDHTCIDCDTCRWMAPDVFARIDGMSAVTKQPGTKDENIKALQALLSCPTNSIHTEKPMKEVAEVNKMFPLPIDENTIPGVYHCGHHSTKTYAATSYFVSHPEGNIMVDCPKYNEILARNIDKLGGVRYLFLTHKLNSMGAGMILEIMTCGPDGFKCERIMHVGDIDHRTEDVERKLHGDDPWTIESDFELIHTPGHTELRHHSMRKFDCCGWVVGSVCLYYRPLKVIFTGDHLCKSKVTSELDISLFVNQQSVSLQLDNVEKLLDPDFNWILPGHGRRRSFKDKDEKNSVIEAFLATKEHVRAYSENKK